VMPWWHQACCRTCRQFGTALRDDHGSAGGRVPGRRPIFTTDQVVNGRHVAAVGAGVVAEPGPDVATRAQRR
jgi:hypothetical protein